MAGIFVTCRPLGSIPCCRAWATDASSGRRSSAIASGWIRIAPSTSRPAHVHIVRSESQAMAARSNGSSSATAA